MDRTGAACYVYAKASGMLAKSFVGSKAVKLPTVLPVISILLTWLVRSR